MPKNNFVTELVNAFNLRNYYFDDVNTNFTVKGNKIVGLFASDVEVKKYFQEVRKEIIKRHYGTEEVAGEYYNLNYFPFVFDVNSKWKAEGSAIRKVELADSTNNEVIRNLKIYFAKEFQRAVEAEVVKNLETSARMMKKKACECLEGSVLEEIDRHSPYLYCISFNDRYCKENRYPPRFFEAFRGMYISAFDLKLEEYGFNDSSIFYEQRDNKLYIKDITNINVVKNVAKHVKGRVALDFRTPGKEDSKVENFKDVLSSLVSKQVRKSINVYDYDTFTDENKIKNGHSFALMPFIEMDDGQFETLSSRDASKINKVFNGGIFNGFTNDNFISDIRGKTANPQFANCKEPVYAFSNKQIALLLPIIMQSPIAYNERNGCFEFAVDPENFKRRGSSRSSSTVTSPTHAEPPRTPPEQTGARFFESEGDRDSGIGESPPKPKDSVAHSSSDDPGSFLEQSQAQRFPTWNQDVAKDSPRQGSEKKQVLHNPVNLAGTGGRCSPLSQVNSIAVSHGISGPSSSVQSVSAAKNVPAGASTWDQPIGAWSSPAPSAEPSLWQPSRPSSWKGANPVGTNPWAQQTNRWSLLAPSAVLWSLPQSGPSSSRGASESMRTGKSMWYVPSSYSPGVEDVNDVEPEKQQVSDECSEAKSQKS